MKVAIPSSGQDLTSPFELRFGRAKWFIVIDADSGRWKACSNETNLQAAQGAGIQAAQNLADLNVHAVVAANVGPKAFKTLKAAGIEIYLGKAQTVEEALRLYHEGGLEEAKDANVESHWG
jgi:predicted Fe-Mo cluster-binding NifX family protein